MAKNALTPAPQDSSENPCDLIATLTAEEQEYHLAYHTEKKQVAYAFRMHNLGASREEVAHKIAIMNWEISPEDREAVLVAAAYRKRWAEENANDAAMKKRAELEAFEKLRGEWTADKFLKKIRDYYVHKHGQCFSIAGQEKYFRAIAYKLSGDPRLESELGMDTARGFLVLGESGTGKTETLKSVWNNPINTVSIASMLKITEHVRENGSCDVRMDKILVLDDVGAEPVPVKYYGTEINWFKDFIEMTYLRGGPFSNLIITTNLGGQQIEDLYGYRVRSRLREMLNVISLNGEDLRK